MTGADSPLPDGSPFQHLNAAEPSVGDQGLPQFRGLPAEVDHAAHPDSERTP